jgi:hypothetical protein
MRGRKIFLQVLLAMALVLSLIVPASVVGLQERCVYRITMLSVIRRWIATATPPQ